MKTLSIAVGVIGLGLVVQGPVLARNSAGAHAGGGTFGGGGFHGGSIGNAGHVTNYPYYAGGYGYAMGPTTFEGDESRGGSRGGQGPVAYGGTGGGPPEQPQDGRGVNTSDEAVVTDGPSWDSDWWAHDPRTGAGQAQDTSVVVGTSVASLPMGGETVFLSSQRYYYFGGTFYESTDSGYRVVAPPIGVSVRTPPAGAELVTVNGKQYLQTPDAYYLALYSGNGLVYKVVEDPHASS